MKMTLAARVMANKVNVRFPGRVERRVEFRSGSNPGVGRCAWRRIKYLRKLTKLLQRIRSVRTACIIMTRDPRQTSDAKL